MLNVRNNITAGSELIQGKPNLDQRANSTSCLGGVVRFFELLFSPLTWVIDQIFSIGKSPKTAESPVDTTQKSQFVENTNEFREQMAINHAKAEIQEFSKLFKATQAQPFNKWVPEQQNTYLDLMKKLESNKNKAPLAEKIKKFNSHFLDTHFSRLPRGSDFEAFFAQF